MSVFGEIDIDDIPEGLARGSYLFNVEVSGPYENTDDDGIPSVGWRIGLSVDESNEDFGGTYVQPIFLTTYPKMTKSVFDSLPDNLGKDVQGLDKSRFKSKVNFYRQLLRQFGIPDDEIGSFNIEELNGKKIFAQAYYDKKSGESRVNSKTFKLPSAVDSDAFDEFE